MLCHIKFDSHAENQHNRLESTGPFCAIESFLICGLSKPNFVSYSFYEYQTKNFINKL